MTRYNQVAAALVAFALVAVSCTDDEKPPEVDSPAGYLQPPEDMCDQIRLGEVLQRSDLSEPSWHEPGKDYSTERVRWYVRCNFLGQAEDGRFKTKIEEFRPSGLVAIEVYHRTTDAIEEYDRDVRNYFERTEGGEAAQVSGWWDTGVAVTLAGELDPEAYDVGDFEITGLGVRRLVRHENLVVLVSMEALSPTEEVDEAAALMEDLAAAMLDESVEHLPRDTG